MSVLSGLMRRPFRGAFSDTVSLTHSSLAARFQMIQVRPVLVLHVTFDPHQRRDQGSKDDRLGDDPAGTID